MREIKFRAWNPNWDEMVYSTLETVFDKREFYSFGFEVGFSHYPEEGWIIAQYTGLKDKNGKEIYEGDVVKRTIYPLNQYSYDEYYQIKELNYYIYKGEKYGHFNVSLWSTDCEVIGNIHDNPELLEVV